MSSGRWNAAKTLAARPSETKATIIPPNPNPAAMSTAPANTGAAMGQMGIRTLGFIGSVILAAIVEKSLRGVLKMVGFRCLGVCLSAGPLAASLAAVGA